METSKLKNMVILKNLPSNIVDEAIIVLKSNKKIKKLQKIEKKKSIDNNINTNKDKDYILKEAEMIVNNYISNIEKNNNRKIFNKEAKEKYNKLKKYSIIVTLVCILETITIIF